MSNTSLTSLLQAGIDLRHISVFSSTHEEGYNGTYYMDKPRTNSGIVYVEGTVIVQSKGEKTTYRTGDLLFFPRDAKYSLFYPERSSVYGVNFNLYNEDGEELIAFDVPTILAHNTEESVMKEQLLNCLSLYRTSTNRIALKGEVFSLVSSAIVAYATKNTPTGIQPAIDTIRNSIHDELRIADLAAACGMSESTFRREFHRYAGVSPKQYILERKINKAKQMLRSGCYPIKEICMILGFFDDAYFSKIFKKSTGLTPMQYAEKAGKR